MDQNQAHRAALTAGAIEVLNRYSDFSSAYRVTFAPAPDGPEGQPRIAARFQRVENVALPYGSPSNLEGKLAKLKDMTAIIRPFYMPVSRTPWDETEANKITGVDFDYAAIIGYAVNDREEAEMKKLYFPPVDAFLEGKKPDENGVWPRIPLPTFYMHQLSLDPRQKFAKFLYLAERMTEGLAYQIEKTGFFYSNP